MLLKYVKYNKVVRDKIPQIIEAAGKQAACETLSNDDAMIGLEMKLSEELNEYLADHSMDELADLLEVIHGILHFKGVSWAELEQIRLEKRDKRGGFELGIFLKHVIEP